MLGPMLVFEFQSFCIIVTLNFAYYINKATPAYERRASGDCGDLCFFFILII